MSEDTFGAGLGEGGGSAWWGVVSWVTRCAVWAPEENEGDARTFDLSTWEGKGQGTNRRALGTPPKLGTGVSLSTP